MLEEDTPNMNSKGKTRHTSWRKIGQSLAAEWIEGYEGQWEALLFSNSSFLDLALGIRILNNAPEKTQKLLWQVYKSAG